MVKTGFAECPILGSWRRFILREVEVRSPTSAPQLSGAEVGDRTSNAEVKWLSFSHSCTYASVVSSTTQFFISI